MDIEGQAAQKSLSLEEQFINLQYALLSQRHKIISHLWGERGNPSQSLLHTWIAAGDLELTTLPLFSENTIIYFQHALASGYSPVILNMWNSKHQFLLQQWLKGEIINFGDEWRSISEKELLNNLLFASKAKGSYVQIAEFT